MRASPEGIRIGWRGSAGEAWARRWWRGEPVIGGHLAAALLPAEGLFRVAASVRRRLYAAGALSTCTPAIPVISVGNLRTGGTGKTPVTRWLAERLVRIGARPAVVHGGYGEDEPALFRRWLAGVPVVAERDRCLGVARARELGATVAVLDDAFQHLRIPRELDIVLVAAEHWTERPRLLPRGAWRESPTALRRADLVIVTRKTATQEMAIRVADAAAAISGCEVCRMRLDASTWRRGDAGVPVAGPSASPPGPVLAAAAIAEPELFLESARRAGADVQEALLFPDHHRYTAADAAEIAGRAAGRAVVVTEKDAVKLEGQPQSPELWVLVQTVVVESGEDALVRKLREVGA